MESFETIVNGFQPLAVISKCFLLDVCASAEYASGCSSEKMFWRAFVNNYISGVWVCIATGYNFTVKELDHY